MASNAGSGAGSAESGSSDSGNKGSSAGAGPVSDYSIHKPYGGTRQFYASFGLKMHDSADYAEGKAITQAFKDADAKSKSSGSKSSGSKSSGSKSSGSKSRGRASR